MGDGRDLRAVNTLTDYVLMIVGFVRMVASDFISKIRFDPPAKKIPEDTNIDGVA